MSHQPSDALRDYELETQRGSSRPHVTHIIHDPDLPLSAPPRLESWESAKHPIAAGGQGNVYVQKCTGGGRRHTHRALKVIRCREGRDWKGRYLRELETMARFSHDKVGDSRC